jgi:alpha-N-arabinofuranosidase
MILIEDGSDRMVLTPTYHVFEMYKVHQDATLLPLNLERDNYACDVAVMPAISATASRDGAGRVHISLSNVDPNAGHTVTCSLRGLKASAVSGRILTADAMDAHNTFAEPDAVRPIAYNGPASVENG